MLGRLGIRQKLSLLLMIPLAAVVLVMVPFTAERIDDARSAGATARTALAAREIGGLIQALQQERLLALGYLSAPNLDRSALVTQAESAADDTARLRQDPNAAEAITKAGPALDALTDIRERVVTRTIGARAAYDAFREANTTLLDALRLTSPPGADAQGLAQLGALEALMRSNEEASSVGAILVAGATDRAFPGQLLADAVTADQQNLRRFRQLVPPGQADLVDKVENGQAGQRIRELISGMTQQRALTSPGNVSEALTAALSYTGLRRLAQDRVAREIATGAQSRAATAEATAYGVAGGAVVIFTVVLVLGFTVSRSISRPLRRLTRAAGVVADLAQTELVRVADSDSPDPAPPRLAAVDVQSSDEIGELADALNRVQATAAHLLERQVTTRRNVAVMFANIARRTQNLVGRQLSLIDDLERNERNPELLQRLYRLDHVATRLRRSADSLLVVSGTIDQIMSGAPTPLTDVIRSALAEIEGFRAVEIGEIADIAVNSSLVADLRLLLAELLENATNFSPPGAPVVISATLAEECRIVIMDHGLGMSQTRLDEENRRLVERERLDVAPTTVLGLFVVGRLARRHGLAVRLDHSEGRGITVTVRVPTRLLSSASALTQAAPPARIPALALEIEMDENAEPFAWFSPPPRALAAAPRSAAPPQGPTPPEAGPAETGAGRVAVEHVTTPPPVVVGRASVSNVDPAHQPLPRRPVPAHAEVEPPAASHGGLSRRVPGTHMAEAIRESSPASPMLASHDEPPTERIVRDPEAEREMLNDYLSGFAKHASEASGSAAPASEAEPDRSTLAERHP